MSANLHTYRHRGGATSSIFEPDQISVDELEPNGTVAGQDLAVSGTAGGVQWAAFDEDTSHIFWQCQGAEVRVTFDGTAPTASHGLLLSVGDAGIWSTDLAEAAKFIRAGSSNAVLYCQEMR